MDFVLSTAAFLISFFASINEAYCLSGIILIITGIFLFHFNFKKSGSIIDPAALFSVSWISSAGISCLKLSNLQTDWNIKTWLIIWLTYICFLFSYKLIYKKDVVIPGSSFIPDRKKLFFFIILLTVISYLCFTVEAVVLGYVPIFTVDTPHAYSYFHISGVHYFTVLCVLVPSLSVLYLNTFKEKTINKNTLCVFICVFFSLLLPVLLVSRYQLVFSCLLALITFIIQNSGNLKKYLKARYLVPFFVSFTALVCLYILITIERAHSVEYLNGIFEMKNQETPIFVTQPYIYIANNFDNLNCLTTELNEHTYGLRSLFPAFALTGLKFIKPELVNFPLYVTKEELTTVTIIYDAYYDFGIPGVMIFSALLGALMALTVKVINGSKNPVYILICAQLTGYLCLSFFTTWYSNPTTWFYIIICIAMNICLWYNSKNADFRKEG